MTEIFRRLIKARGLGEEFLHPKYEDLADPYLLPDMDKAVERILQAVKQGEKVLIYGDYDVDGVTASTVMYDTLSLAGVKEIEVMLPDRFRDGYGMSERVVERAKEGGFSLVVTVDCGSRNDEIIKKLKEVGCDTVVTDHHECGEEAPTEAVAVVNPKRSAQSSSDSFRDLAGVGVAFEVARALVKKGAIPEGQEKWLLDLVTIGTLCDSMRLSRENRIMTYWGLKVLAKTRRLGIQELVRVAKISKWDAEIIGFRVGPRLNAAGRIESAEKALRLLMTKNKAEAAALAEELDGLNRERKEIQRAAIAEIRQRGAGEEPVIVVEGEWHEGVLGIIAGRLVEEYRRPAFVLAEVGEGVLKGSGRSFGEFSLAKALEKCKEVIISGGGHAEACGLKVERGHLEDFRKAVNEYYRGLKLQNQEKFFNQSAELSSDKVGDFSLEFIEELAGLEPFGEGNEVPLFALDNALVKEARKMGKEGTHLSLLVEGSDGAEMRLVGFSVPKNWLYIEPGQRVRAEFYLAENNFRDLRSAEGRIVRLEIVC